MYLVLQKDDLQEQLQHEQKMLKIRRRNLRTLEEQEANYGLAVPMEIRNQIAQIKEYIRDHEKRIDELQIIMSEGDEPISEVEYAMHLAEVWDMADGYPKYAHLYRLDFTRLRLHITPERARKLELSIRHSLALEAHFNAIRNIDYRIALGKLIKWIYGEGNRMANIREDFPELSPLWKTLSLDPKVVVEELSFQLDPYVEKSKKTINNRIYFLLKNHYYFDKDDKVRLMNLLTETFGPEEPITRAEAQRVIDELFPE
jgi:hypothetical protein